MSKFGIKIGNSTLCISTIKSDGKIEVIANKQGDRVSQACILFEGNELECGLTAKQKMPAKLQASLANSFQFLLPQRELTGENLTKICKYIPCKYDEESNNFELQCNSGETPTYRKLTPQEACVELFKAEFELAKQCLAKGEEKPTVVLSIPDYYPMESWAHLAASAETAGFHVAQICNEPTAAVLAYKLAEKTDDKQYVLCIKSGGLLSSFSLFELFDGLYRLVETIGPFYIGGKQFTDVLVDFINKEFYKKYRLDPQESRRSMAKIRVAADNCKHCLTNLPTTQIYIDSLMDGVDFNMQMSRARYDMLIQPVLNEFSAILNDVKSKFITKIPEGSKINEIVLCGATLKIPKFQDLISNSFSDATLNATYAPDEVVAIGCAYQSSFCSINPELSADLSKTLKCGYVEEPVYIWHDENNAKKSILVKKGEILPTRFEIDVERFVNGAEKDFEGEDDALFRVESNNVTNEILVKSAKTKNGIYRLEATFQVEFDESNNALPKISLESVENV